MIDPRDEKELKADWDALNKLTSDLKDSYDFSGLSREEKLAMIREDLIGLIYRATQLSIDSGFDPNTVKHGLFTGLLKKLGEVFPELFEELKNTFDLAVKTNNLNLGKDGL